MSEISCGSINEEKGYEQGSIFRESHGILKAWNLIIHKDLERGSSMNRMAERQIKGLENLALS